MEKKQAIIELWRACFNDSDAFIELFFDRIYKDENALTLEQNGTVVAALQLLPYTMTYYDREISVGYIYGACTSPDDRNKGYMKQLMDIAWQTMRKRDVALAAVIPATPELFDFYRKLGFSNAFDYAEIVYNRPEEPLNEPKITVMPPEEPSMQAIYKLFDERMRDRVCCVLHTYDDFINILRDCAISNAQVLAAIDDDDSPVGLMILSPASKWKPGEIYIREMVYTSEHVRDLMLQEATLQNNVKTARYRSPYAGEDTITLGMAAVVDRKRMLHHWAETHEFSVLNVGEMEKMDDQHLTTALLDYENKEGYISLMFEEE